MLNRSSVVNHLHVDTVAFSSIIELGDSSIINGLSRALAVQRQAQIFFGNEGNYSAYRVFSEPIPLIPIEEDIYIERHNLNPTIIVNNIDIIGISSSSILHVGNSQHVYMEARIKHIRQLLPQDKNGNNRDNNMNKKDV